MPRRPGSGARLAAAGLVVATGGGPGAMEAANLGALAARRGVARDGASSGWLRCRRSGPSVAAWVVAGARGAASPAGASDDRRSLGIPTWFYGHEPPNVFCDGIGKYFSNAIREDGLLARATAGLVVLEGAAGTVQEIFQAVTPLFYAPAEATAGAARPRRSGVLVRDRAGLGRGARPRARSAAWARSMPPGRHRPRRPPRSCSAIAPGRP